VTRESRRALDRLLRGAARGQAAAMAPEDDAVSGPAAASARTADRPAAGGVTPAATTEVPV
jgi:hypothetical protein